MRRFGATIESASTMQIFESESTRRDYTKPMAITNRNRAMNVVNRCIAVQLALEFPMMSQSKVKEISRKIRIALFSNTDVVDGLHFLISGQRLYK